MAGKQVVIRSLLLVGLAAVLIELNRAQDSGNAADWLHAREIMGGLKWERATQRDSNCKFCAGFTMCPSGPVSELFCAGFSGACSDCSGGTCDCGGFLVPSSDSNGFFVIMPIDDCERTYTTASDVECDGECPGQAR